MPVMTSAAAQTASLIGKEVAVPVHLQDGLEFEISTPDLISFGQTLFLARWTSQEGQGRPLRKGTGDPLSDLASPLLFLSNFNRLSEPDANTCSGCHNTPFVGAGGDRVSEEFVLGQRFDFLDFDHTDTIPTSAAEDELGSRRYCFGASSARSAPTSSGQWPVWGMKSSSRREG